MNDNQKLDYLINDLNRGLKNKIKGSRWEIQYNNKRLVLFDHKNNNVRVEFSTGTKKKIISELVFWTDFTFQMLRLKNGDLN